MLGTRIGTIRLSHSSAATIASELLQVGRWHGEIQIERATDSPLRLEARARVLVDDDEPPAAFAAAFKDLGEGGRSRRYAAESQSQLPRPQRIRATGPWKWDPREERLVPSDKFASLRGLSSGRVSTISDSLAALPSVGSAGGQLWRRCSRLERILSPSLTPGKASRALRACRKPIAYPATINRESSCSFAGRLRT
jgi:hypothetical protein